MKDRWSIHEKQTFVRPSGVFEAPVFTYGVMAVNVAHDSVYSCGADGRLVRRGFLFDVDE